MSAEAFLVPFGLAEDGRLVARDQVEKGERYRCPECETDLIVKAGEVRRRYLAHRVDTACEPESVTHKTAKLLVAQVVNDWKAGRGAVPVVERVCAGCSATWSAPLPSRIAGAVGDALDKLFGLMDLLAIAAVAIAGLGILNTLSMDTRQRLRELGMLRAAGMSKRQVWRSVLIEAGILGAVGGGLGCITGLVIGLLLSGAASGGLPVNLSIPWPTVGAAFLSCIALAMLAAFQPARMAGRVSIVAAVRGE